MSNYTKLTMPYLDGHCVVLQAIFWQMNSSDPDVQR